MRPGRMDRRWSVPQTVTWCLTYRQLTRCEGGGCHHVGKIGVKVHGLDAGFFLRMSTLSEALWPILLLCEEVGRLQYLLDVEGSTLRGLR